MEVKLHNIKPERFYILNNSDPKRPSVSITNWLFREFCQVAIDYHFPGQPLVEPILGKELLELGIKPKASKYGPARFRVLKYPQFKGLTRKEKVNSFSAMYRRIRKNKFRKAQGFKKGEYIKWGDILPKNFKDENGKTVRNPERYRLRRQMIRAMTKYYDDL